MNFKFASTSLASLFLTGLVSCQSTYDPWQFYRIAAFYEARDRGLSIAIHFDSENHCATQKEALLQAVQEPRFKDLVAFRVQMGKEPKLERSLGISQPCSLVVFKGSQFKGKIVDELRPQSLKKLLALSL